MSTLQTANLKNASSGSNNIVLATDGSTTITTLNSTTITGTSVRGAITSGTAVASTSGTSIDFTSIPSWAKRVTVILRGISTNGTSPWLIRIGTSGGFLTTGYSSSAMAYGGGGTGSTGLLTSGFSLTPAISAASVFSGTMILVNISSTFWVESFSGGYTDLAYVGCGGGTVDAGGTLDRIRVTTVNGTDTFDAGSINILYEG